MKPKHIKYVIFLIALVSVAVSVIKSNYDSRYPKQVFHIVLIAYYTLNAKKINPLVYVFFGSAMVGEFLSATDFEMYLDYISICFTVYFTTGIILLHPLLKSIEYKLKGFDILTILFVMCGLGYVIGFVYFLSIEQIKDYTYFSICTVAFVFFIASCFSISGFHKHPKKIFLFIMGAGYIVVCIGTLIHELQLESKYLIGTVNLSEVIAQFSFIYFMLDYKEVIANKEYYL